MKLRDKGELVLAMQRRMLVLGYPLTLDADLGTKTFGQLRQFCYDRRLVEIQDPQRPRPRGVITRALDEGVIPDRVLSALSSCAPALRGIDLSAAQGPIDAGLLKAAGIAFAWVRLSMGRAGRDVRGAQHLTALRGAGIPAGGYHLVSQTRSAADQAENVLSALSTFKGGLRVALDVEGEETPLSSTQLASLLTDLSTRITQALGKPPIWYTSARLVQQVYHLEGHGPPRDWWQAYYSAGPRPTPLGWPESVVQQTGYGPDLPGISTAPGFERQVDRNLLFASDLSALLL